MTTRKNFEMSAGDLADLLAAMTPAPYICIGGIAPRSTQENANAAWARLGEKLGFDPMTVQPTGRGDRYFSAVAVDVKQKPHVKLDGNQWCATWPDFTNLQESNAGFGDTPELAIAALITSTKEPSHE